MYGPGKLVPNVVETQQKSVRWVDDAGSGKESMCKDGHHFTASLWGLFCADLASATMKFSHTHTRQPRNAAP